MKKRTFFIKGYEIELIDFGYKVFFYPSFNRDAEFEVSSKGFRKLSHYIRTIIYFRNYMNETLNNAL